MMKCSLMLLALAACRCTTEICGDGAVGLLEECDDGNDNPADGCNYCYLSEIAVEANQGPCRDVAVGSGGRIVVVWGFSGQVFARIMDSNGIWAGPAFRVNQADNLWVYGLSVDMDDDGGFMVAWESDENLYLQGFDSMGQPVTSAILVFSYSGATMPILKYLGSGRFLVVWQGAELQGKIFFSDGTAASPQFLISSTSNREKDERCVASWSDGRFVVAWLTSRGGHNCGDVTAQMFDQDGNTLGIATIPYDTSVCGSHPSLVAVSDGGYWIGWYDAGSGSGSSNFIRRYDASGQPVGEPIAIHASLEGKDMNLSYPIDIFAHQGDGLLGAWYGTYWWLDDIPMIFGLALDPSGNPTADAFFITRFVDGNSFALDSDDTGRTAVVWCDGCRLEESTDTLYLQRIREDGTWTGVEPW